AQRRLHRRRLRLFLTARRDCKDRTHGVAAAHTVEVWQSTPRNRPMESDPLLDSLRNAVAAMPDDVPLRLHLAALLLRREQRDEAVRHLGAVLQRDPGNAEALALLTGTQAASGPAGSTAGTPGAQPAPPICLRPPRPTSIFLPNGRGVPLPSPIPRPAERRGAPRIRPRRPRLPPSRPRATTGRRPKMSCGMCCPRCSWARPGPSRPGST